MRAKFRDNRIMGRLGLGGWGMLKKMENENVFNWNKNCSIGIVRSFYGASPNWRGWGVGWVELAHFRILRISFLERSSEKEITTKTKRERRKWILKSNGCIRYFSFKLWGRTMGVGFGDKGLLEGRGWEVRGPKFSEDVNSLLRNFAPTSIIPRFVNCVKNIRVGFRKFWQIYTPEFLAIA